MADLVKKNGVPQDVQDERASGIHKVSQSQRPLASELGLGALIGDRYVITGLISAGATSHVYAALDEITRQEVAVKVVRYGFGDPNERSVDRLQLELFVYQLATSRHLPRLLDAGRLQDRSPYIVMERVHGQTLAEKLSGDGSLSIAAVLELGQQLMHGLHAAHGHGIIHRDVKPRNLLLESGSEGVVLKIIDFGICSRTQSTSKSGTLVLGTPSYMSPEQITGGMLDARTDIYSGSVVLYQALTGRLPFEGGSSMEILTSTLHSPLLPPRLLRETCPIELEECLFRGLAREPDERFSTADAMANELSRIAEQYGYARGADAFRSPGSLAPRGEIQHDAQTARSGIVR